MLGQAARDRQTPFTGGETRAAAGGVPPFGLWWVFGEPRRVLRPALKGLPRYIVTA